MGILTTPPALISSPLGLPVHRNPGWMAERHGHGRAHGVKGCRVLLALIIRNIGTGDHAEAGSLSEGLLPPPERWIRCEKPGWIAVVAFRLAGDPSGPIRRRGSSIKRLLPVIPDGTGGLRAGTLQVDDRDRDVREAGRITRCGAHPVAILLTGRIAAMVEPSPDLPVMANQGDQFPDPGFAERGRAAGRRLGDPAGLEVLEFSIDSHDLTLSVQLAAVVPFRIGRIHHSASALFRATMPLVQGLVRCRPLRGEVDGPQIIGDGLPVLPGSGAHMVDVGLIDHDPCGFLMSTQRVFRVTMCP